MCKTATFKGRSVFYMLITLGSGLSNSMSVTAFDVFSTN